MAERDDAREAVLRSLSAAPLRSALRPINVPRPSNLGPGADSRISDDSAQNQNEAPGTESNTTTRDYNSPLNSEHAPRETVSFKASRFKTNPPDSSDRAPLGEPKAFARLRQSEAGNQSDSPRTPGSAASKGNYDLFKTRSRKFSGPLEKIAAPLDRQLTRMRTRRHPAEEARPGAGRCDFVDVEAQEAAAKAAQREELQNRAQEENGGGMKTALSAGRYFDALTGPELEEVKDKESLLLPEHELWPFLLRFPIGTFGVALGLGSQTMLWKNLALVPQMTFLQIPTWINLGLWCVAVLALVVIFICYFLKIQFYFEAVRREYHHPVRVNFFFAPWIACMFLATGVPPQIATTIHPVVWCVFMFPVCCLELKIYGQWLSGGQRRLSKVANPSTHLSVVGNFVGSNLAAIVGWKEPAIFFWAVGLAHYIVLFVTLYQRLPTNETLPTDLHPVFFLFVAAPSASSLAWMRISGEFDYVSRIVFFIALFLYTSLIVRINFFRGFKFSIAWWAYTFPMTAAGIASIQYAQVAPSWITRILALVLSLISSTMVCALFISTLLHMFYWRCLFPNDLAIAITAHKPKTFVRVKTTGDDKDDGCGLYSLQNSEPLYKSMLDAYHSFLAARERNEAVVMDQGQTSPTHLESSTSSDGSVNGSLLHRSPSP